MSLPGLSVGCAKAASSSFGFASQIGSPLPLPTVAAARNRTASARVTCQLDSPTSSSSSHAKRNLSAKVSSLSDPAIESPPAIKAQSSNGAIKSTAGKDSNTPVRKTQTRNKISQEELQTKVEELRQLYSKVDEVRESYEPPDIFTYYENVRDFIDLPDDLNQTKSTDWPLSLFSTSGQESTQKNDPQANVARFFCPLDAKPIDQDDKIIPRLFYLPGEWACTEGEAWILTAHRTPTLGNIFLVSIVLRRVGCCSGNTTREHTTVDPSGTRIPGSETLLPLVMKAAAFYL